MGNADVANSGTCWTTGGPVLHPVYPRLFFSSRWGHRGRKRPPRHAHDRDAELALRARARRRVGRRWRRHLGAWERMVGGDADETVGPTHTPTVAQLTPPLACWPIRPPNASCTLGTYTALRSSHESWLSLNSSSSFWIISTSSFLK
jgi:hypothetical protein